MTGYLYIVATPIGCLQDMTYRAVDVLKSVDFIAAEDTRHSKHLLHHFGIATPLISYHAHNETQRLPALIKKLKQGFSIALISDAGTPLINDPGFVLVKKAHEEKIKIIPLPGSCAAITALSVSGLDTQHFLFQGFLPARSLQRKKALQSVAHCPFTLIFYEAPHRLMETLQDMIETLGAQRLALLARELTKTFETLHRTNLEALLLFIKNHPEQQQGESVLIIEGCPYQEQKDFKGFHAEKFLNILLKQENMPLKKAVHLTASVLNYPKNKLYSNALAILNTE